MRRVALGLIASVALLSAGCSLGGESATTSTVEEPHAATAAAPTLTYGKDGCDHQAPPASETTRTIYTEAPPTPLKGMGPWTITMVTSCGSIVMDVDTKIGGDASASFAALVRSGYYDGLTFHRVVPNFVIQGGDPAGTGAGGPGYSVQTPPPSDYAYRNGDVAMAKAGNEPDGTAGSQFFIVSTEAGAAALEPLYAVVGHVLDASSTETLQKINRLGIADGPPVEPVYIWTARLTEAK